MSGGGSVLLSGVLLLCAVCLTHVKADSKFSANATSLPCDLCECFTVYEDCDVLLPDRPSRSVIVGFEYILREDHCLRLCIEDQTCEAAVYGVGGGIGWYVCELYSTSGSGGYGSQRSIEPATSLLFVRLLNTYIKRVTPACSVPIPDDLETPETTTDAGVLDRIALRKLKWKRLFERSFVPRNETEAAADYGPYGVQDDKPQGAQGNGAYGY